MTYGVTTRDPMENLQESQRIMNRGATEAVTTTTELSRKGKYMARGAAVGFVVGLPVPAPGTASLGAVVGAAGGAAVESALTAIENSKCTIL